MSRTGDDRSALPERAASGSSLPAREAPTRTAREALRRPHWLSAHRERIEQARSARAGRSWSEAGDTLIEVLISATLMGIIVVATLSGLSSSSKATAVSRARSQADALAQQDEDYLRAEPIANLIKMNRTRVVTETGETYTTGSGYKGTIFTVHSVGEPKEETGTSTCSSNSANPTIPYIRTVSEVTWGPSQRRKVLRGQLRARKRRRVGHHQPAAGNEPDREGRKPQARTGGRHERAREGAAAHGNHLHAATRTKRAA